jgi:hypothetical protein
MELDPYAPPPAPPTDLNAVLSRPATASPPPVVGSGMVRARQGSAASTPPSWSRPESPDAFARSMYESERRSARSHNILVGMILLVVGIIITAATYDSASRQGGTYIIAWGPMVYGAIRLFKGLAS